MFFKEKNEIDLGETTIANIFIDIFMPMANGLFVKVYLLGYRQACDPTVNPKFDNSSIARDLNVPLSDVIDAWKFWNDKHIIKLHKNSLDDFDYSIEFMDLKKFYMDNMNVSNSIKSNSDKIVAVSENPKIRFMFNSINTIIGRYLTPDEKTRILDIMDKYNMSSDMIIYAYQHIKDKNGSSKPLNYIEGMLRNWYDQNIYTVEEVKNSFEVRSKQYEIYRTIFNALGFTNRNPSESEKKIMDEWIENVDIEIILEACSKSKNISNPNIAYIDAVIKKWIKNDVKTLNDIKTLDEEHKRKSSANNKTTKTKNTGETQFKTKFHNFNQRKNNYSPEEFEKIILESQKNKF
jgi:DnaD/phage-associated family protein